MEKARQRLESGDGGGASGGPVGFDAVADIEWSEILQQRARRDAARADEDDGTRNGVGLALSGGGIRSAAICLGAIQALRVRRRFDNFDYLSTVSGGGYIGACLTAAMSGPGETPPRSRERTSCRQR